MLPLWQEHNFGGSEREVETNIGEKTREKQRRGATSKNLGFGDQAFRAERVSGQHLGPVWELSGDPKRYQSLGPIEDRRFSGGPGYSQVPFWGPWVSFSRFS